MTSEARPARVLYDNLDTSFVNLWGLLRYLSQRSFVGRIHVELDDYAADVFLKGSDTPLVHEIDRAAGTDVIEESALHRLVLRVRESPGKISVYEGADEAAMPCGDAVDTAPAETSAATPESVASSAGKDADESVAETTFVREPPLIATADANETTRLAGELIAAMERAATSLGVDFPAIFQQSRIALGDDYPFLDPLSGSLRYENSSVTISGEEVPEGFVAGVSEALRRVVDQLATGERARRTRERIALELARVARKNPEAMATSGFKEQLDRIAGTKVL
jgi:hypothetical protein